MSKLDDKLNTILGVPATSSNEPAKVPVPRKEDKNKQDIENDYKYSREKYYNLKERGQQAIQGILDIAEAGQHPRAYEVAGNMIKQVADTVDKLQDLQGKLKLLKDVPNKTTTNVKNALFVGSSAELHKMLAKNKKRSDKEDKDFKQAKTVSEQSQDNLEPIYDTPTTSPMSDE